MKELMLGNAAVARGLYEGGCRFVSSYPGTPSTEITENVALYDEIYAEWAPNEKVAFEATTGASLAGARSFCAMKHVGLNVAADPLFTVAYTGINGGMVVAVADDQGMHSSQNEQDSRHYAMAAKVPMVEPSNSKECLDFTKLAFELSEEYDTFVMLRTCTRVAHSQSVVEVSPRQEIALKPYEKDPKKYVMMPGNAIGRHVIVEDRMNRLRELAETTPLNRVEMGDTKIGFITAGICYEYVREVFPNASVLKLGLVNPLPEKLIRDFAASVDRLIVVEELDGFIETHCRALGIRVDGGKDLFPLLGELSQVKIAEAMGAKIEATAPFAEDVPARPPVLCPGCPHRGLYYALSKLKLTVLGDIGCYTLGALPPLGALDTTLCMGASVSSLHGFDTALGGGSKSVAVIGDSTFMHSGITGLVNIVYNNGTSTVLILDNSITGMTGHQQNPTTGLTLKGKPAPRISIEKMCEAAGVGRIRVIDPYDMDEMEAAILEEIEANEPSVIIARRPCALLPEVRAAQGEPMCVDHDACRGCRACMKIGCPAISFSDKKATIDTSLCVGCGLCSKMCKYSAISKGGAV